MDNDTRSALAAAPESPNWDLGLLSNIRQLTHLNLALATQCMAGPGMMDNFMEDLVLPEFVDGFVNVEFSVRRLSALDRYRVSAGSMIGNAMRSAETCVVIQQRTRRQQLEERYLAPYSPRLSPTCNASR
jgi:hypothetical protein